VTSLTRHHTDDDTVFISGHVGRLRIWSFWGCRNDEYAFSNVLGLELQVSSLPACMGTVPRALSVVR